ncbi:MAG: ABC transporter permease subunit [Planctomycetota bacterium]
MTKNVLESGARILAVTQADLRALSRARGWGLERTVFVGILVLTVALTWPRGAVSSVLEQSAFGARLFGYFFATAYVCTGILVPFLFSGVFMAERQEGGGHVLFSTPLHGAELVTGRFLSHFGRYLLILACGVPVLFSTLLFGGVGGEQILVALGAILTFAFFAGSLTFFFSAITSKGYSAGLATILFLFMGMAVVTIIGAILSFRRVKWFEDIAGYLVPQLSLGVAPFSPGPQLGNLAVLFVETLTISVILLVLTAVVIRPFSLSTWIRDRKKGRKKAAPPRKTRPGTGPAVFVAPSSGVPYRGPVWRNPMTWKEVKVRPPPRWIARIIVGAVILFFVGLLLYRARWSEIDFAQVNAFVLVSEVFLFSMVAVNHAATAISKEWEEGRTDLLAATPLTAGEVLRGKWAGVLRRMLPWWGFLGVHFLIWGVASLFPGAEPKVFNVQRHGWHPMNDLLRFLPMLSVLLIFLANFSAIIAGGLLASMFGRKSSNTMTLAGVGLIFFWVGPVFVFAMLGWQRFLEKNGAFSPFYLASGWAMTQAESLQPRQDLNTPTLLFLGLMAVIFVVCTLLFLRRFDRAIGRSSARRTQAP